jgi:hypothetical protein
MYVVIWTWPASDMWKKNLEALVASLQEFAGVYG